ncbi:MULTISPECIES: DUF3987 domain-containing protein [Burkholderia cepacia complex]|uniref:DUF3987 domain-containing protein n=1 Tax=Burkholderia cepacia complex TaxID=87882 RepID=UPI0009BAEBCB|nr:MULTISPECIES: DUF3987 domain-containing protein [Burkholderia cepacia complex]MBU9304545.1 DUF3987 domain-containing protein [Burkholderia multivorans]MBU9509639.1 DUF3987 domain-containing protein [Burkholderia multivorans]PRE05408.1 DUF3987 domain-containing protein [Burkholderia multivorans]
MPIIESRYGGSPFYQQPYAQGAFPLDVCPPIIADAAGEVSWRLKIPIEMAAQAALGATSLSVQNYVNVQCPGYEPAPVSLILLTISNSSGGKSLTERCFLRAVSTLERRQDDEFNGQMVAFQAEMKIWLDDERQLAREYRAAERGSDEAERLRNERLLHEQSRPVKPSIRVFRMAATNPQGLRDTLIANGAVGIFSADGGPTLNGETFSQPAVLCDYWSGEERATGLVSGMRRPVEPRLTISVMTQGDQFSEYMRNRGPNAFGTGLLARCLPVFAPVLDMSGASAEVGDVPEPKLDLFNERMLQILSQPLPSPREREVLKFSDDAKTYWKCFKEAVNNALLHGDSADNIKSFFRKLAQMASRIAALFHYVEGGGGDISGNAMKAAIALCEWYVFEYAKVFGQYALTQHQKDEVAAQKLLEWLQDAVASSERYPKLEQGRYTERDLRNYSSIRNDPDQLRRAIDMLGHRRYISVFSGKNGGRVVVFPANDWVMPMPGYFSQTSSNSHAPMMPVNQSVVGASCASVGFAPQQRDSDPVTDMERAPDRSAADGDRNVEVNEIYRFLSEKAARALSD